MLTRAYLVADILQRASYSPMRPTMSVMAGQAGTDRWIMTGGILLVAGCSSRGRLDRRPGVRSGLLTAGLLGWLVIETPGAASWAWPSG